MGGKLDIAQRFRELIGPLLAGGDRLEELGFRFEIGQDLILGGMELVVGGSQSSALLADLRADIPRQAVQIGKENGDDQNAQKNCEKLQCGSASWIARPPNGGPDESSACPDKR